ncbi:MAG: type IV pilus modification protein PilV [Chromatiales bacterium]
MVFTKHPYRCQGFSLLEVLITFIVLSVGLLGLAALDANGLKNNQSAYWRSQATILGYSIIDSMRANRTAALNGDYNLILTAAPPSGSTIVAKDLLGWIQALSTTLPEGDGAINCNTATAVCQVVVQWDDRMGEGGSSAQSFSVTTQL